MRIPKYIQEHIDANSRLLAQADKHAMVVMEWYDRQLERLNADESEIPDEEFAEVQTNWRNNGEIDLSAIRENLELLENEMK